MQKGGRVTTLAGTAHLRIQLYNYMNSRWVAFDDVTLETVEITETKEVVKK